MKLFHFFKADDLSLLRHGMLPFDSVKHLHDPFLNSSHVFLEETGEPMTIAQIEAELKAQYEKLDATIKAMVSFDYFCEKHMENPDNLQKTLRGVKTDYVKPYSIKRYQSIMVARLFGDVTSLLNWSLMGAAQTGFALEINTQKAKFFEAQYKEKAQRLEEIIYRSDRPVDTGQHPFTALMHAPVEYETMAEWRLIRPQSVSDSQWYENTQSFATKIPLHCITKVVFGALMTDVHKQQLLTFLKNDMHFKSLPVYQASIDPHLFSIKIQYA